MRQDCFYLKSEMVSIKETVLGQLTQCNKMEMMVTFTAKSKKETKDFLCKLREDCSNLNMECGDGNKEEEGEEDGAVQQFHTYI